MPNQETSLSQSSKILNPLGLTALVFDFGGTLDFPGVAWYERLFTYVNHLDSDLTWERFLPVARQAGEVLAEKPEALTLSMEATVGRLVEHIVESSVSPRLAGRTLHLTERFVAESLNHLRESRAVLQSLAGHYRLACISNNWGNAAGWCAAYELDGFFEFIIDSAAVGFRKPDTRIFALAIERLGLLPEQIGYVGDQFKADVVGSKKAGMRSIWYVGANSKTCPDETLVDHRIAHLSDLQQWIARESTL